MNKKKMMILVAAILVVVIVAAILIVVARNEEKPAGTQPVETTETVGAIELPMIDATVNEDPTIGVEGTEPDSNDVDFEIDFNDLISAGSEG